MRKLPTVENWFSKLNPKLRRGKSTLNQMARVPVIRMSLLQKLEKQKRRRKNTRRSPKRRSTKRERRGRKVLKMRKRKKRLLQCSPRFVQTKSQKSPNKSSCIGATKKRKANRKSHPLVMVTEGRLTEFLMGTSKNLQPVGEKLKGAAL